MVAIGKVVFTSREHIIALEARDKRMMGITLRYPYEVRKQSDYFEDIKDEKVPKDMLDLALHIVGTKRGDFDPEKFEDQYEDALKELLSKKQKGEKIERPREPARSNVVNLMDALRGFFPLARHDEGALLAVFVLPRFSQTLFLSHVRRICLMRATCFRSFAAPWDTLILRTPATM